jgi:hypothetical protein
MRSFLEELDKEIDFLSAKLEALKQVRRHYGSTPKATETNSNGRHISPKMKELTDFLAARMTPGKKLTLSQIFDLMAQNAYQLDEKVTVSPKYYLGKALGRDPRFKPHGRAGWSQTPSSTLPVIDEP